MPWFPAPSHSVPGDPSSQAILGPRLADATYSLIDSRSLNGERNGLIKASIGAIGGTLADQWKDFFTVPANIQPTAALFPAVLMGTNSGRGSDTKASQAIVTNGSKIVVPRDTDCFSSRTGNSPR